ncbi:MAG: tetratricopeptide repeat protein [Candidatus Eisenbacteria sp.]|nr:tetratricopeptide repeat protein [Candidatus Eisenbacteria bacterium]
MTQPAKVPDRRDSRTIWFISLLGIAVLLVHLAASLSYSNWFWGFHHYFFLPRTWTVVLLGIGCLLCLPWNWSRLSAPGNRAGLFPGGNRLSPATRDVLIAAIFGIVFWQFRMPLHFLGDGRLIIRLLDQGFWFHPHEPLDRMIHAGVLQIARPLLRWDGETVYSVLSVTAGAVYVFAALRLGRLLGRRVFVTSCLMTLGTVQLFFGYAESYSLATAMILVYLLTALQYLAGTRRLIWIVLALVAGIALHFALLFLVPSFLYLLWAGPAADSRNSMRRLGVGAVLSAAATVFLLAMSRRLAPDDTSLLLVPILPDPIAQYTLLSWEHLVDVLNEQVLISPLGWVVGLGFVVAFCRSRDLRRSRRFGFLMVAGVVPLLFNLILRPGLGGSRDWDLWSLGSLPFMIAAACWLAGHARDRVGRRAAWVLVVVGLFHILPWIGVNHSRDLGLDRFDRMLENNALWTAKRKAAARAELAGFYFDQYAWAEAAGHFEKAAALDPERARYWCHLGTSYLMLGQIDSAEDRILRSIRADPNYAKAYCNLAQVYFRQGRITEAEIRFRRAVELDPGHSNSHFNLGNLYRARGEIDLAIESYRHAVQADPRIPLYWSELAKTLERAPGRRAEALDAWRRVEALTRRDPSMLEMLGEAQRRIENGKNLLEAR